jgi:lipoyl synthase
VTLRVRWLGSVPYREALAIQQALFDRGREQHLLLLEHPHVFTFGPRSDLDHNLRCDPDSVGADLVGIRRGGDITYHGPGQLVGYPIITVTNRLGAAEHVRNVEQLVIDTLARFGVAAGRLAGYPGVWVDAEGPAPRKICAIGVRLKGGRTMHGFALNVTTDMTYLREHIVACGIDDRPVTSLAEEGVSATMREVVDAVARFAAERWGNGVAERQDVAWRHRPEDLSAFSRGAGPGEPVRAASRSTSRLAEAGVTSGLAIETRKPEWLRPKVRHGAEVLALRRTIRELGLVTVCEDAGCPNLSECWADGTATFMVLGDRCTRACGFCLVDTRHPLPLDDEEPARVADGVAQLGLAHAVVTSVARDDVPDGGAGAFAATIRAIRARTPATAVEVLIPDCKGDRDALAMIFDARPDVLNHNLETVARLQRTARPSAAYFRSLALLARAKDAGLTTKSGIILGMGETEAELRGAIADLRNVGVDILTLGQYLRPSARHLPVVRWWTPEEFDALGEYARGLGFAHVESGPLVRSSYHARRASESVGHVPAAAGFS